MTSDIIVEKWHGRPKAARSRSCYHVNTCDLFLIIKIFNIIRFENISSMALKKNLGNIIKAIIANLRVKLHITQIFVLRINKSVGKRAKWSLSWCLIKRGKKNILSVVNVMFSLLKLTFCERDNECHLIFYLVRWDCPLLTFVFSFEIRVSVLLPYCKNDPICY